MTQNKLIDKLLKMRAARDGEAKLGNIEAAEAFAAAINRLMLENEINEMDLEAGSAAPKPEAPIVRVRVDLAKYGIKFAKTRVDWQERLASIVAQAHLCRIFIHPGTNHITFVGTEAHAGVAEFTYGTLVPLVATMSKKAETAFWIANGSIRGDANPAIGYRAAWIRAFVTRIAERFKEERHMAEQAHSTAMVRLSNALVRVDEYIKQNSGGAASQLNGRRSFNSAGARDGRAAADRIKLGADQIAGRTAGMLR